MGYQQFRRKIFGENISEIYFSSYFSQSQISFRYQFLHVKEFQSYVLCFLACSKPSGHAFASSGVRVNSDVHRLCRFCFNDQVLDKQCLASFLSYCIQFCFSQTKGNCSLCSAPKRNSWVQRLNHSSTSALAGGPTSCPVRANRAVNVQSAVRVRHCHAWTQSLTMISGTWNVPQ